MATEVTSRESGSDAYPGAAATEAVHGTVDTDGTGNGTLSVTFGANFSGAPVAVVGATADAATTVQNVTADGADIAVSGSSTTSGTVNVSAVFIGGGQ